MAFMDKLKGFTDTVSAKGAEAVQKAKDMAEVASLNSQIKTENDGIKLAYQDIGEKIFNEQRDMEDSPFIEQINSIKRKLAKITELEKEISNIKGTKKCPNCGEIIGVLAEVCPKCQAPCVIPESEPLERVCPACGEPAAEEDTFCANCGRKL